MQILKAKEEDITEIVSLLKISLGESLMPKSESYWRWKHIENPFGESPVLIARDDGRIVGVRAFMRWQWTYKGKIFRAVRAVDTATHPDYQGKGIFKKLTLSLLDQCKAQGDHFVFNTPNKSSKPGYLKMGWREVDKLPVSLHLSRPMGMILSVLRRTAQQDVTSDHNQSVTYYLSHPGLENLIKNHQAYTTGNLVTQYTKNYLRWRYEAVVTAEYEACGIEADGELKALLFYRIKPSKTGSELRVTDFLVGNKKDVWVLLSALRLRMREHQVHYVTLSGCTMQYSIFFGFFFMKLGIGPMVTVKNLNMDIFSTLYNFKTWTPSLGDLELF